MNILRDSSFQDDVIIKIFKPSDMKNNKKIIAKKNSYAVIKLSEIENFNEPNFYISINVHSFQLCFRLI